jgi:uncharacterized protein YjbI with pentapeptide repeats
MSNLKFKSSYDEYVDSISIILTKLNINILSTYLMENYSAEKLTHIRKLTISSSVIIVFDLENISEICPYLHELDLNNMSTKTIKISENIKEFKFSNTQNITNIDLTAAVNVNDIILSEVNSSNLNFNNCNNLTNLDMYNCTIEQILNLTLENLEKINIVRCKLSHINLDCSNLTELILIDNNISKIDLSNCPRLKICALENNKLSSIDVSVVNELQLLYLCGNYIASIDNITGLYEHDSNLLSLNIKDNPLKINIEEITATMPKLRRLYVDYDQFMSKNLEIRTYIDEKYDFGIHEDDDLLVGRSDDSANSADE